MKYLITLISLISISSLQADVIVKEGQIVRMKIERFWGSWDQDACNYIEQLKIIVKKFKVTNENESDRLIIEAINSGKPFDILLAKKAKSYAMYEGNKDYKYLAKHNVPLTSLVRPKMYVTGKLRYTRYNSSMKTAISLIEPTFTSKLGQFYQEGYTSSKSELNVKQQRQFDLLHENK